jgi:transcriptional regulator with XRE-family HTH domain
VATTEHVHYSTLIAALRARRQALGLSQTELEERLGLTRGHLGKYENGIRRPTGWNLSNWALALGCHLTLDEEATGNSPHADQQRGA